MQSKRWSVRILRYAGVTVLALVLCAVVAIQIRQRLFRRQAERLHAEIMALQLHPGTFADIQRLQREWGAYGDYTGPCTEHHCIYNIEFEAGWRKRPSSRKFFYSYIRNRWLFRIYFLFGGHLARAIANVRVRDNRMWGADFALALEAYPGEGRNEGEFYENDVDLASSTRLSDRGNLPIQEITQGFRTREALNCAGCEFASADMTPQTSVSDIERFNRIQFNCLTGWRSCRHPADLAPTLWAQALQDERTPQATEGQSCRLPAQILAREANDIALVKVISIEPSRGPQGSGIREFLTVRILQPVKNGRAHRTTDILRFSASPLALKSEDGRGQPPFVVGSEYFFLYRQPWPDEVEYSTPELRSCHAMQNTPQIATAVKQGIALDPSAGEPYNYRGEPYAEQ